MSTAAKASASSPSLDGAATLPLEWIAFSYPLDPDPRRLSVSDLVREIGDGDGLGSSEAVANLVDACLLARSGEELVLSPAALRVDRRR